MTIASVFDAAAKDYDMMRRKYIACFDDFYGVAISQIPFPQDADIKILDLGAGTGLFSSLVRARFPNSHLTLTDVSEEMLEKARERFKGAAKVNIIKHDYINEPIAGEYDVVVSALSLHHGAQEELKAVFDKLFSCLKEGGIFINADQILGRTPEIEEAYEMAWIEQAKANKCTAEEIDIALKRMESDKTLPLSVQLSLLAEAGFARVNCWYQFYRYAVYTGTKRA